MYDKKLLAGKIAVVTGGGTGIGKAVATALALHGADVALASRDGERLEAAAAEIRKATGRRALGISTDVSDAKAVRAMFDKVESDLGPVSILINGAAANFVRPSEMLTSVRFQKVIDIVLHGSFNCAVEAGRRMLPRGEGSIVSLLASYAWTGAPGFLPSSAAKAGVQAMTKTLGVEWHGRGVRVNAVCPGLIDTPKAASGFGLRHGCANCCSTASLAVSSAPRRTSRTRSSSCARPRRATWPARPWSWTQAPRSAAPRTCASSRRPA